MAEVKVWEGDITRAPVDAIVNAANERLAEGGGVCGAIFAAAGRDQLAESCAAHSGCPTGGAVVTPAHRLAERGITHIVHAVGPRWARHGEERDEGDQDPREVAHLDVLLASAYRSALAVAEQVGAGTVAFPSISTGIFGFPLERASAIAAGVVTRHVGGVREILLVAFDGGTAAALRDALDSVRRDARQPPSWADPLFELEPLQWGLRGDPLLWSELRTVLAAGPPPTSGDELRAVLLEWIERLVGLDVRAEADERVRVPRYPTLGMSGGWISVSFWRDVGVPLLVERFARGTGR